jgi:beta-glucosidase
VNVTNTGRRTGDEVVQLYVRHPSSRVARARRDLRGFARITLAPGETRTVALRLPASSLAYWDEAAHRWALEPEPVTLEVGASSADVRLQQVVRVRGAR